MWELERAARKAISVDLCAQIAQDLTQSSSIWGYSLKAEWTPHPNKRCLSVSTTIFKLWLRI